MKKHLLFFALNLLLVTCVSAQAPIIVTVAGNHAAGYSGDGGYATSAELYYPEDVAVDAAGTIYIADWLNGVIRKVNPAGIISTFAGGGTNAYNINGVAATSAYFASPNGVAVDGAGNVYIADGTNDVIRMVNSAGIINTIAGTGVQGYSGDGGPATAAQLYSPRDIAIDAAGNIFFTEMENFVVRKINTAGVISTVCGNGTSGYSGDGGPATSAQLNRPMGVAVDAAGNIYVAEDNNNTVRKVNTAGIISTFAGTGAFGNTGNGGLATLAKLHSPMDVEVDASGNVYIDDSNNHEIRKVNSAGIITAICGNGTAGYSGDGGPATAAALNSPFGIAVVGAGNIFIADFSNQVIREVSPCIPAIPQICMVQVDSLSQNNIIYWDKTPYTADTFYIYRDTANYNYALIGTVPYDSLSLFTDTVRSLYAANGDPNASSWRYKIAYRDTCGGVIRRSPMSPWHQTLFMINSGSSFMWTMYQIEGQSLPVPGLQNYLFERDDNGVGNYVPIQTLSASSTLYTDPQYASYQNTANWRVETKWTTVCTPTLRLNGNYGTQGAVVKSRSNVKNNRAIGIAPLAAKNPEVRIYPNPNNGSFNLTISQFDNSGKYIVEIYNVLGEKVYIEKIKEAASIFNVNDLESGIYQVQISKNSSLVLQKKIVKQ